MSGKWRPEEEHLLRILISTNTHAEIFEEFNRRYNKSLPGFHTERSYDAIRRKCSRDNITEETIGENDQNIYDERWERIKKMNAEYMMDAEVISTGLVNNATRKILSFSDIHFPFALYDELQEAIEKHSDAEICVLNGDILDGYVFSTYGTAKRIAALKEYIAAFELVRQCSETFEKVLIISGNHDRRPAKALARADFRKDASQVLRPDLLARMANGEMLDEWGELTEKLEFDNVVYQKYDSWYARVGKTIFCHPDAYQGGQPGATVMKLNKYFKDRIGGEYFDSVVVGHTHRIYKGIFMNKLLIEQGAMCSRQPYQHKSDLRFPHAMNGYAVIYQDDEGNTCFNKSHVVYLGSQLPPKKEILWHS